MLLFCPKGHEQTGQPAMGGLCGVCIQLYPDEFACKDAECSNAVEGQQHFHPDERSYFLDVTGKRW